MELFSFVLIKCIAVLIGMLCTAWNCYCMLEHVFLIDAVIPLKVFTVLSRKQIVEIVSVGDLSCSFCLPFY